MTKLHYHMAERVFWGGAIVLFTLSLLVGWVWGLVWQLPIVIVLMFWGVFVRRYLTK
jgi:hypothetical protein